MELFFEGGEVLFLEPFDLETFHDIDGAACFAIGFPVEEGGFGDAQLFGD